MFEGKRALVAIGCITAILVSSWLIFKQATGGRQLPDYTDMDRLAGELMAREIRDRLTKSGDIVVITVKVEGAENPRTQAALEGLKSEIANRKGANRIRSIALLPILEKTAGKGGKQSMFGEEGIPPQQIEGVIRGNMEAAAIVSLVGVPFNYRNPSFSPDQRPIFAAIVLMLISGHAWAPLIENGYMDFIILPRVQVDEEAPESDFMQRFQKRFRMVDKANLGEALRDYMGF